QSYCSLKQARDVRELLEPPSAGAAERCRVFEAQGLRHLRAGVPAAVDQVARTLFQVGVEQHAVRCARGGEAADERAAGHAERLGRLRFAEPARAMALEETLDADGQHVLVLDALRGVIELYESRGVERGVRVG